MIPDGAWFLLGALVAWLFHERAAGRAAASERAAREERERLVERVTDAMRETTEKALMLKGLHPHYAAPSKFTPSGMSAEFYQRLQEETPAPTVDDGEEEEQNPLQKLAQDREEWDALLAAAAAGSQRLADPFMAASQRPTEPPMTVANRAASPGPPQHG